MFALVAWTLLIAILLVPALYFLSFGRWPTAVVYLEQGVAPVWRAALGRAPRVPDGISLNVTIGDLDTRDGSNVQIGIFGLMGSDSDNRRAIQKWIAPWLSESEGSLSQGKIWEQRREASRGKSGTWFTGSGLQDWLDNGSDCLWLYGESHGLRKKHAQAVTGKILLAFTFFAWDLTYTHSKTFVARTLLALLSSIDPLLKEIKDAYEKVNSFETVDALILIQQILARPAAKSSAGRVTDLVLIVDAIDEIPSTGVRLQALAMLKTLCTLARSSANYRLRVILTSRYDKDVRAICTHESGWTRQNIPESRIKEDINLVLEARMRENPSLQGLVSQERFSLADKIVHKSGFSFRLASMYMDALLDSDLSVLKEAQVTLILDDLPGDLFVYYDRILARIQTREVRDDIMSALRLLLFAAEPLTVEQLVASCATIRFQGRDRPLYNPGLALEATDLVRLLNGLVEPAYSDDIKAKLALDTNMSVRMKHFSVVEWLRSSSTDLTRLEFFHGPAPQRHITLQCFAYLVYCHENAAIMLSNSDPRRDGSEQLPFARYAAANWFLHAAAYLQADDTSGSSLNQARNSAGSEDSEDADHGLTRPTAFALRISTAILAPALCNYKESRGIQIRLEKLAESLLDAGRVKTLFGSILKYGARTHPDNTSVEDGPDRVPLFSWVDYWKEDERLELPGEERRSCAQLVDLTKSAAFIFNKLNIMLARTYGPMSLFSMNNRGWEFAGVDHPLRVSDDECDAWPPSGGHEVYDYPLAPGAFLPPESPLHQPSLYHMIGECYLDRMMDGQIMDRLKAGKCTVKPIRITWERDQKFDEPPRSNIATETQCSHLDQTMDDQKGYIRAEVRPVKIAINRDEYVV
ncbi:hypothetical protein B0A48_17107 [Cryoendolithus antarcticus]|uniref:Nephrocystin 3-like N-terminal domain-containing protein n=1 Tax=Cryoendolithus antarcticus TaxID=1507870 RepID=A0A1V8SBT2_9PEZI|nr:hypothetical protein B0A48_17107 [Cryoendolithus antarcticus]